MPRHRTLFQTIPIDVDEVRRLVDQHWSLQLADCLKVSQNHTYRATNQKEQQFIVRVTPDPQQTRIQAIELETQLLDYLSRHQLPVSRAIPSSLTSNFIVSHQSVHICSFEYAHGQPLNYSDWTWMTDENIVHGLGRWMARLHQLTRRFVNENPEIASHARHWKTLHEGVLAQVIVDERDQANESDPSSFGLIHGDINVSNYFWDSSLQLPWMFDWDQLQKSWFLYDLSAPIWGVTALEKNGSPIDRSLVPQANSKVYTEWLIEGYESENQGIKIDREALQRMVLIRRELYRRFCRQAVLELSDDHPMAPDCRSINEFFEKEENEENKTTE